MVERGYVFLDGAYLLRGGQPATDPNEPFVGCRGVKVFELVGQQCCWHEVIAPALHPTLQFIMTDLHPNEQDVGSVRLQEHAMLSPQRRTSDDYRPHRRCNRSTDVLEEGESISLVEWLACAHLAEIVSRVVIVTLNKAPVEARSKGACQCALA